MSKGMGCHDTDQTGPGHPALQGNSAGGSASADSGTNPVPEEKRDIAQFLKELDQAHDSGWDEARVRDDLIQQIEKERQELKRWLACRGEGIDNHPSCG